MQCLRPPEEDEDAQAVSKADTVRAPHVERESRGSRRDRSVPESVAGGRYQLKKKLGEGSFGMVFIGVDTRDQRNVAVKLESQKSSAVGQLANEARLMEVFAKPERAQGFTEVMYFQKEGNYAVLVMDLLGLTLEHSVQVCGGQVNFPSAAIMAEQAIFLLAYVHSKGIVHRDIKSENFMWGTGNKQHHLYCIDFGMSTRYFMKRHVSMATGKQLTGTARYASINAMKGCTQSRRDDLEALAHMLMYSLRGHLPWSGLDAPTYKDKLRLICQKKADIPLEELCAGYPEEFMTFLHYSRTLEFAARPDYEMLVNTFRSLRQKTEPPTEVWQLQWLEGKDINPEDLEPLKDDPPPAQPDGEEGSPSSVSAAKSTKSAVSEPAEA